MELKTTCIPRTSGNALNTWINVTLAGNYTERHQYLCNADFNGAGSFHHEFGGREGIGGQTLNSPYMWDLNQ